MALCRIHVPSMFQVLGTMGCCLSGYPVVSQRPVCLWWLPASSQTPSSWLRNASTFNRMLNILVLVNAAVKGLFRKLQMAISGWRWTGYSRNNISKIIKSWYFIFLTFKLHWIFLWGLQKEGENWEGQENAPSRIKSQLTHHQWRRIHFTWSIKRLLPIDLCS